MTNSLQKTVSAVLGTLFVLGVVFVVVMLVAPGAIGAEASYVVLSGSMAPTIQAGDVVVVSAVNAEEIETGDVITYSRSSRTDGRSNLVTHRVIDVTRTDDSVRFTTQGDANEDPDADPVSPSQVVGVVWFHLPLVGHLVLLAQSRYGIVLFVIIPSLLLVGSELYSLYTDALVKIDEEDEPVESAAPTTEERSSEPGEND